MTCDLQEPCECKTPPANSPPSESAMVKLKRDLHSVETQMSVRRQAIEDHLHIVKRLIEYRAAIIGKMNPPEQDIQCTCGTSGCVKCCLPTKEAIQP